MQNEGSEDVNQEWIKSGGNCPQEISCTRHHIGMSKSHYAKKTDFLLDNDDAVGVLVWADPSAVHYIYVLLGDCKFEVVSLVRLANSTVMGKCGLICVKVSRNFFSAFSSWMKVSDSVNECTYYLNIFFYRSYFLSLYAELFFLLSSVNFHWATQPN